MAVKVIGSSLILSFFFLCIMSYKNITVDEFNNFQGVDVTASCGCAESMKTMCVKIGKACNPPLADENTAFKSGFPKCVEKEIQLQKDKTPGAELVKKKVQLLVCSWVGGCVDNYFTKGQGANHVMNYNCDPSTCVPYNDIKIQQ